jgi:hypothetical protein
MKVRLAFGASVVFLLRTNAAPGSQLTLDLF